MFSDKQTIMPGLQSTLQNYDMGFLKIIGDAWGIELKAPSTQDALPLLIQEICRKELVLEIIEALPQNARSVLNDLIQKDGKIPWSAFIRQYGHVRVMGAGRRDRERPDLTPISPAEVLWYRGLIGKAFLNLPPEPQEFAYIPDEIKEFLKVEPPQPPQPPGAPARPDEYTHPLPVTDHILDHACTLLAALRMASIPQETLKFTHPHIPPQTLTQLLRAAHLLDDQGQPVSKTTKTFLESSRAQALTNLTSAWMESAQFNELSLLPDLEIEGVWQNDPLLARKFILNVIKEIPSDTWWSITALIQDIKKDKPDFQRPAGDYDSWFIRSRQSGTFLRGFSSWDQVDGKLVYFILSGPLHWLGVLDLAASQVSTPPTAFRLSRWAKSLLEGSEPKGLMKENDPVRIKSDASFTLTNHTPRSIRYIIARFCQWQPAPAGEYSYVLTPESLGKASERGLKPAHLLRSLKKYAGGPIPPGVQKAIERWSKFGPQAQISASTLLEVSSPEILEVLKKSHAARYISRTLTPTVALVHNGAEEKIRTALAELGYLAQVSIKQNSG